ncbi:hypothetical protein TH44_11760 [Thalassospira xiamenensis]|uniref:Uncharacterized protein n=1 Tax=Thalassospira xiamenensis TaxID=220697 RepID=A0A367XAG0_9PROT|nr:hypothetical protein AUP41_03045 [Thalassospira xiamenensis]RCK50645.1 hypothetical protein TH44_11760 [Thalassospira xiamenensis]
MVTSNSVGVLLSLPFVQHIIKGSGIDAGVVRRQFAFIAVDGYVAMHVMQICAMRRPLDMTAEL